MNLKSCLMKVGWQLDHYAEEAEVLTFLSKDH